MSVTLYPIAHKPLASLTASDIRATYEAAARRSLRRAEYAMQILRAVLRWNGVVIPGNPLGQETAGRDRITITAARGDPAPIPPELLGAWWRAAERAPSQVASDYYRFQLLTGCRGVEIAALRATGVTILVVEQNARAALEVADYGYVLEMGEIALEGPAGDLARDPRVIETYLGATRKKPR